MAMDLANLAAQSLIGVWHAAGGLKQKA